MPRLNISVLQKLSCNIYRCLHGWWVVNSCRPEYYIVESSPQPGLHRTDLFFRFQQQLVGRPQPRAQHIHPRTQRHLRYAQDVLSWMGRPEIVRHSQVNKCDVWLVLFCGLMFFSSIKFNHKIGEPDVIGNSVIEPDWNCAIYREFPCQMFFSRELFFTSACL